MTETDVLIIGAGAAGTMAALCAATYGMKVRIIEKRPHRIAAGHADGLWARTMEILDSYGLADKIMAEGIPVVMSRFYEPDSNEKLVMTSRVVKQPWQPPSPFVFISLSQARVQRIMEERIEELSDLRIERGVAGKELEVDVDEEYPVNVAVRKMSADEDATALEETIRARYVIACDGVHSWTRSQVGIEMQGDSREDLWGVMDVVPITDFPTPRLANRIVGKGLGLLWIPRERGLVRVYCLLQDAQDGQEKLDRSKVTPDTILAAINEVLYPYTLAYETCEWWTAYETSRQVATINIDSTGHVFLAGDAFHTHSPQAGQGINAAIGDIHNLMWKLNLVINNIAAPEILETYHDERLPEGRRLVDFDRMWSAIAAGRTPPALEWTKLNDMGLGAVGSAWSLTMPGLHVTYPPGILTCSTLEAAKAAKESLDDGKMPDGIVVGMRMPSFRVRRHADMVIRWLGQALKSDGRFRFVVFAGDISKASAMGRLKNLASEIESMKLKELYVDVVTVHTADPQTVDMENLPDLCVPQRTRYGYDYGKLFFDEDIVDHHGVHIGSAYEKYGVDREVGRLVLVRPDGYVALQCELDDFEPARKYFNGFIGISR